MAAMARMVSAAQATSSATTASLCLPASSRVSGFSVPQLPARRRRSHGHKAAAVRAEAAKPQQQQEEVPAASSPQSNDSSFDGAVRFLAKPVAAALAAALVLGAVPDDALAAQGGGRVGGRAFRSSGPSMRTAPSPRQDYGSRSAPPPSGGYGGGYAVPVPQPYFSPFGGFSPFGFSPFGFAPTFFLGGSSIFNLFVMLILFQVVFSVIRGFMASRRRDDDDMY
eukprot:jgi/Chlat1/2298/Chrsp17S02592